jgi:hypothetical protein
MALAAAGFSVAALAPVGNWIHKLRRLDASFSFRPYRSGTSSVARAIRSWQPDILVPCDDPALSCLLELYAQAVASPNGQDGLRSLIRASLGEPSSFAIAAKKSAFVRFAAAEALDVPATVQIRDLQDLHAQLATRQLPQVLKIDSTWGGNGVRFVQRCPLRQNRR